MPRRPEPPSRESGLHANVVVSRDVVVVIFAVAILGQFAVSIGCCKRGSSAERLGCGYYRNRGCGRQLLTQLLGVGPFELERYLPKIAGDVIADLLSM